MLASRSAGVDSRGAVLGAPPPPQHPQAPPPQHSTQSLHMPIHMPQLGAPFIPTHHPLLQYDNLVRPVVAHRYEQSAADAADAAAAVATDRLFRQTYYSRMRSEYEATAMFSPPDLHMWMTPTLPPPPAPPPHQSSLSGANGHATHGVLRHPQARTSPPTSGTSARTPSVPGGARDSPAPVNLSAPHKGAQAGFSYPMLGTTSLYPSYAHPSMMGRTTAVTASTATYSPPAASPAPVPAVMPLGPPSAPPRRRMTATMSSASTVNLPPPSAPPPTSSYAPTPSSVPSLPAPNAPTPVSAAAPTPARAPAPNEPQVVPPAVTKDLACFKRGARIRLASGEVRSVETMRAEDLVTSADPALQSYAATVLKLTAKPGGTVAVAMSLRRTGENSLQFESEVEVSQEHPFFVYSRGWTSFNPHRSSQLLGLKCHRLQVGDVCISLARLTPATTAATPQSTATSRSSGAKHSRKVGPSTPTTQTSGATDAGSSANARKRRWSAPDQLEEEAKTLKTSH